MIDRRAIVAGAAYFALVFALGFMLGALRVVVLTGSLGASALAAVLIEIPVMLAASWIACGAVLRRCGVTSDRRARASMGATAFMLLMLAETALDAGLSGVGLVEHVRRYAEIERLFGLAAQILFASMPLLRRA